MALVCNNHISRHPALGAAYEEYAAKCDIDIPVKLYLVTFSDDVWTFSTSKRKTKAKQPVSRDLILDGDDEDEDEATLEPTASVL